VLRIVIDARSISRKKSGIGNTLEALLTRMLPLADDMRFTLLRNPERDERLFDDDRVREIVFPGETKSVQTVFALGLAHRFANFDLFHSPADLVPIGLGCPWVVTIHDLMWVEAPELASAFVPVRCANGIWYRANFAHAIRGARNVIAISRATRSAIERVYPSHAAKVRVVHHGFDAARYASERGGPRELLDTWLPRGASFSLIVGQGSPYKNHPAMIRAFVEAMGDRDDHKLVLVRRFSRVDFEMQELLRKKEVQRLVVAIPHVSDELLFTLYRHARMLLFASLYEGFGLPALEAMGFGVPVLASTADAVLEVTGDAALHADPASHRDLADKIRRLDADDDLRQRLVRAGRRRITEFSWDSAARATLDVYREASDSRRSGAQ
jgi:glycosyltransferase involved in cell wall biosynthesis